MKTLAFWRHHARVFDGYYTIAPEDVDALYIPRHRAPSGDIALEILAAPEGSSRKFLMCGSRGSGKSTELIRVATLLRADYTPVRVDVAPLLHDGFTTLSLVVTLAAAVEHTLRWWNDPRPEITFEHRAASAAFGQFTAALSTMGTTANHAQELVSNAGALVTLVSGPTGLGPMVTVTGSALKFAAGAMSSVLSLLSKPEESAGDPGASADGIALVGALNALLGELLRASGHRPVLLVEGFDKARELRQVDTAMEELALLEAIEAPTVFSGPVTMLYNERYAARGYGSLEPRVLSNVPIVKPPVGDGVDAAPDPHGLATMRQMFLHRATREGLPDGAVAEDALELAVSMSSGLPREMFAILEKARLEAIKAERTSILIADVHEAVTVRRHQLQNFAAAKEIVSILQTVLFERTRPTSKQGLELLYEGYIAAYPNGDTWFRPHEILVDWLRRTAPAPT
jgi:hypothetical protein